MQDILNTTLDFVCDTRGGIHKRSLLFLSTHFGGPRNLIFGMKPYFDQTKRNMSSRKIWPKCLGGHRLVAVAWNNPSISMNRNVFDIIYSVSG